MAKANSTLRNGKPKSDRRRTDKFAVCHARDAKFKGEGLRPFFVYRDLGIKAATGGRMGAHVIRAARSCDGGTGRHRHRLDFQLVYILKGKVTFWYEGEGNIELAAGSCVYQPPGIVHELITGSDDLEMLEITLPAEFETEDVAKPAPLRAARQAKESTAADAGILHAKTRRRA